MKNIILVVLFLSLAACNKNSGNDPKCWACKTKITDSLGNISYYNHEKCGISENEMDGFEASNPNLSCDPK